MELCNGNDGTLLYETFRSYRELTSLRNYEYKLLTTKYAIPDLVIMRSLGAYLTRKKILLSTLHLIPALLRFTKALEHCYNSDISCSHRSSDNSNDITTRMEGNYWRSYGKDNDDLISQLKNYGIITSDEVEKAMRNVDRGNYCPRTPYLDSPQPIGYGVTISAPHMHAHALEILKDHIKDGSKVLDVGSGANYVACLHKGTIMNLNNKHM